MTRGVALIVGFVTAVVVAARVAAFLELSVCADAGGSMSTESMGCVSSRDDYQPLFSRPGLRSPWIIVFAFSLAAGWVTYRLSWFVQKRTLGFLKSRLGSTDAAHDNSFIPKRPYLMPGKAYFLCGYVLRDLPVPIVDTVVFFDSRTVAEGEHEGELAHYFKRPEDYYREQMVTERRVYLKDEFEDPAENGAEQPIVRILDRDLKDVVYDYEHLRAWIAQLKTEHNAERVLLF